MAACSLLPLTASAGLFDDDEARRSILDLRGKMTEKADKTSVLDLASQNEALRQEIAKLRGDVEVLTNDLSTLQKKQKDFYMDLDARLRKLEPQKVVVDGKEASVDVSEQKSYDAALNYFEKKKFKSAIYAFSDFLGRYPQSGYAASAQYFLGISYFAQRDFRNAISAQAGLVKNYPDSPKAADAMLNMASSYAELNDKASARKTMETLIAKYPDSQAAQNAKQRLSHKK